MKIETSREIESVEGDDHVEQTSGLPDAGGPAVIACVLNVDIKRCHRMKVADGKVV